MPPSWARMADGEVAEVVDRQRDVGGEGLAHGLAVLPRLGDGQHLQVLLHAVGDLEQDVGALGRAGPPQASRAACAASRASSTSSAVERATLAEGLARSRG